MNNFLFIYSRFLQDSKKDFTYFIGIGKHTLVDFFWKKCRVFQQ